MVGPDEFETDPSLPIIREPQSVSLRHKRGLPMIPRTEGYLTTEDGEQIWYETAGAGPDLILNHGLGGNAAVWYQQLPYFAERHRVITWDQRGFGRSSNTNSQHGPQSAVGDLLAIMDHCGVEHADVIGQSMGGWVAMGLAIAAPERVRSIVLACTTGGIPVSLELPSPSPASGPTVARPLGEHPALGERLQRLDLARAYLYQALGAFGSRPPDSEFFRLLTATTFEAVSLKQLDIPVLLIAGELDELMTPKLVREAAGYLSRATVVELPERGHSPYFEDPDAWNTLVAHFLAR